MKKNLFFVAAALVAMFGTTSCVNEVDMFKTAGTGTISLNVTNDDVFAVETRASVSSTSTDWYVKVNNDAAITVSALQGKAYTASQTNSLSVYYKNATLADALAANNGWGEAFWYGTSDNFVIEAGKTTTVNVTCGTAQDAAFSVAFNESFTNVAAEGYKVTASMSSRSLEYNAGTGTKLGYFEPGTLTYVVSGTVNGKTVNISKNLTLEAGTKYVLTVKANTNGTIGLSITYTEMADGAAQEVTIDAATGAEVNS